MSFYKITRMVLTIRAKQGIMLTIVIISKRYEFKGRVNNDTFYPPRQTMSKLKAYTSPYSLLNTNEVVGYVH